MHLRRCLPVEHAAPWCSLVLHTPRLRCRICVSATHTPQHHLPPQAGPLSLLVVYGLRKYIGEYIEGDINFEWTDSVRLGPLSVNAEALNREFELSGLFGIQGGTLGRLEIDIPWANLTLQRNLKMLSMCGFMCEYTCDSCLFEHYKVRRS